MSANVQFGSIVGKNKLSKYACVAASKLSFIFLIYKFHERDSLIMGTLPKDNSTRIIGSKGRQLVHASILVDHWEYRESTGVDRGIDCELELIEDGLFTNRKIQCQVKGTQKPEKLKRKNAFSFAFEIKTIEYALNSSSPFVLFYADVIKKIVYYLPIQDYFIDHPEYLKNLTNNASYMNVHIPCDNILNDEDSDLQKLAKITYVNDPQKGLTRISC